MCILGIRCIVFCLLPVCPSCSISFYCLFSGLSFKLHLSSYFISNYMFFVILFVAEITKHIHDNSALRYLELLPLSWTMKASQSILNSLTLSYHQLLFPHSRISICQPMRPQGPHHLLGNISIILAVSLLLPHGLHFVFAMKSISMICW